MKKSFILILLGLIVASSAGMAQTGEMLMIIDGQPVPATEYESYCRLCHISANDRKNRLDDFVNFKLKALEALEMGCDTLVSFCRLLDALTTELNSVSHVPSFDGTCIKKNGWVKVEILTIPVRQDVNDEVMKSMTEEMVAIYHKSQTDQNFTLRTEAEGRMYRDGARWLPVEWFLPEVVASIQKTPVGRYSDVFVSSAGVNLLKVIDKTDDYTRTIDRGLTGDFPLKDILLAMYWDNLQAELIQKGNIDSKTLADFFKKNRKLYTFDLPHYKGVVVHCSDKRSQKIIKRKLRKLPYSQWPEQIELLASERRIGAAQSEYGLYQIGTNDVVDGLVFKCIQLPKNPRYPYPFVKGKVLEHAPESFEDIREKVTNDYVHEEKRLQTDALRQRHAVEYVDNHYLRKE